MCEKGGVFLGWGQSAQFEHVAVRWKITRHLAGRYCEDSCLPGEDPAAIAVIGYEHLRRHTVDQGGCALVFYNYSLFFRTVILLENAVVTAPS